MNPADLKKILALHQRWIDNEDGGVRANLDGANLDGANLYGANLDGANLGGANLRDANLDGANLGGANLRDANLDGANLDGANLVRANLYGANLGGANLGGAKEDYLTKLALQRDEVVGLYKAILEGKINGSTYNGDCACFVGTIANIKGLPKESLAVKPDSESPTERLFLAINKGDTPENNPISKIVAGWTEEFMERNEIKIPKMSKVWD